MILKQFTVSHCYPGRSHFAAVIGGVRRECLKITPTAKSPKLGDHTTLLPPFRAHPDEMRHFSMALEITQTLYEPIRTHRNEAKTKEFDFFRNPGNDALVLRLCLPEGYRSMIEKCREKISDFAEWTFPPHDNIFHPHVCVVEEACLYSKIQPHMRRIQGSVPTIRFHLPFPQIMVKVVENGNTHWEKFDPKKQY